MSLRKTTLILSITNTASISLGFISHILLGRQFGVSRELDCLFAALAIFGLAGIFNSFFTSLFIPIFNEIKHRDERDSFIFADVTLKWATVSAVAITAAVWLSGDLIIRFVASGFKEESVALTLDIIRILFMAFVFNSISNSAGCILSALYHFSLPAITGLLHPVFTITALLFFTSIYGVKSIAISYLASNFLQACILLAYMALRTQWRPTFKLYHDKMPFLVKQSSKMTASGFIWSLRDIISRNIASYLAPGAITLLAYAEKIISILLQVAVTPPSKVFYSRVSELIVGKKWPDIRELFERVVRVNMALVFFLTAGVIVFLVPLLNILFLGSRFTANDINILFYLILIMLIYLIVIAYETYLVQIVYAQKMATIVGVNASVGVIVFFISAWLSSRMLGVYGIAIGIAITQIIVCFLYYYFVNKQLQIPFKKLLMKIGKGLIIAFVFAVLGIGIKSIIYKDSIMILFVMPVWISLYSLFIRSFMKKEIEFIGIKEIFKSG